MATFILIHGAWHGSWCWERVAPLLTEQGHTVITPDLPGTGKDSTPLSDITVDHWTHFICDLIRQQNEKVILVGHSRGGIVISQVAEYCSDQIQGLVYLTAFLIPNGGTLWETLQRHPRPAERPMDLILSADQKTSTLAATAIHDTFYNTTPDDWLERAISLVGPEPMVSFVTPLKLTAEHFEKVPRAYVECLQDRAIPLALQRSMEAKLPCKKVVALDTDHSPFYSSPQLLVSKLVELAMVF